MTLANPTITVKVPEAFQVFLAAIAKVQAEIQAEAAKFGAAWAEAVAERVQARAQHRNGMIANRQAVTARRRTAAQALTAFCLRRFHALDVDGLTPRKIHASRFGRTVETFMPPTVDARTLASAPNAPPAMLLLTSPMGETN